MPFLAASSNESYLGSSNGLGANDGFVIKLSLNLYGKNSISSLKTPEF